MERPISVEIDCSTGIVTERYLSDEEIAQREAEALAFQEARAAEEAAAAEAKVAAEAKLEALGLTPEDLKALLS